jgi:hypothetical protein
MFVPLERPASDEAYHAQAGRQESESNSSGAKRKAARHAPKIEFLEAVQADLPCLAVVAKIYRFTCEANRMFMSGIPSREHAISRKTIAQGRPDCFR